MYGRKRTGAVLMCATFVLIAAAPLVQSADDVHEIIKTENGPPSTCALTWEFYAPVDGTWHALVENHGMRWIILDMIDLGTNDVLIDRDMYRYAVYGDDFETPPVEVLGGHTYQITGTPNGPLYTSVTVTDMYEPYVVPEPPVAAFTVTVDGLTVTVDASGSSDPDGTITDYDWDWGDGTTGTGMIATHTYVEPESAVAPSTPTLGAPQNPYYIYGVTKDAGDNPLPFCTVTIMNMQNGGVATVESSAEGKYLYNLASMGEDYQYADGDLIVVEAVLGSLAGSAEGNVDLSGQLTMIDVVLEDTSVPFDVTITLTVTDNDGLTASISHTVTLYP